MKRFLRSLFKTSRHPEEELPDSMTQLRPGAPCWCGSGRPYRSCHRPEDRRRAKELGLDRRKNSICEAFL